MTIYYAVTGTPIAGSRGASTLIRTEYALIQTGFAAVNTDMLLRAPIASPTFTGTVTIPAGAAISGYAPLASPAFTGIPTAPTASVGTNTTQIATMAALAAQALTSALPGQSGNDGGTITTNGAVASWVTGVGQSGKLLTTNGTAASWTDTLTGHLNNAADVTIASASTVNIGAAASNNIIISGTTTITAFDTIAAGATRRVKFSGALTLTHNATSLIIPGGANITTAANDTAQFTSLGSGNWICDFYSRASGIAIAVASQTPYSTVATSGAIAGTPANISFTGINNEDIIIDLENVAIASATAGLNIALSTNNGGAYGAQVTATGSALLSTTGVYSTISITGLKTGNVMVVGGNGQATLGTSGVAATAVASQFTVGAQVNAIKLTASGGQNFANGGVINLKGR
jgi:hypothetical protein